MTRSFRFQLALRYTLTLSMALAAVSVMVFLALQATLDRELNASLMNVASIQAASVTDAPSGAMAFHEWELTPSEAASVRDLNRYAEVWNATGRSLLRTRYITSDLPLDTTALRRAAAGQLVRTDQRFQGMPIRSLYYPLERLGPLHAHHVLQVAAPLDARNRLLARVGVFMVLMFGLVGVGTFAGSWWLGGRAVRPVHEIIDQAEAMRAGTLQQRISAYADLGEYKRLVNVLNSMLDRLEHAFEAQRRFTADASHELRSPLTALRGELEVARRRPRTGDEYERVLDSALEEVVRLSRTVEDLLMLARSDAGAIQPRLVSTDLAQVAARAVERLAIRATDGGVKVSLDAPRTVRGLVDPDLMERLIWNLVDNAIKFTPRGGQVAVGVHQQDDGAVVIEVGDTGPGLPEEDVQRIFERFFRADPSRTPAPVGGTGLGLSIASSIAQAHHGVLTAENRAARGALFRLRLPSDSTLTPTLA